MANEKKTGINVKNLGKQVAKVAAGMVKEGTDKVDAKTPAKATVEAQTPNKAKVEAQTPAKPKTGVTVAKKVNNAAKPPVNQPVKPNAPVNQPVKPKGKTETLYIKTGAVHLPDIRKILKTRGLTPTETKENKGRVKDPMLVTVELIPDTIKILKSLKYVLGANLPTAINRVELYPQELIFEFYVKYGRGQIYDKRAKTAPGINCRTKPDKKKTTAGDMRSVHLVTLKIPATPFVATQVGAIWKLLKYSLSTRKD